MDRSDNELVASVKSGNTSCYEELVVRYQPRVFGLVRRHAKLDSEVADIVQEIFIKAYTKLASFRGDAPFEHWLMKLATRTCYDFLRKHQRSRERPLADVTEDEQRWLETIDSGQKDDSNAAAASQLVNKLLDQLSAEDQLVIRLLDLEGNTVREIFQITGWSVSLVKVRAFRARGRMRKLLEQLETEKYL